MQCATIDPMTVANSIKSLLQKASNQLKTDEALLEARLLLQHALQVNHAWLIAHADDTLDTKAALAFNLLLQRRISGEPIAYILGEREFYGLKLKVSSDTLIPRSDTETLVEATLDKIPVLSEHHREPSFGITSKQDALNANPHRNDIWQVLDLGTGTGAIALAIAKHRPQAQVIATDASSSALKIAQENADRLNMTNVSFIQSNWFDAIPHQSFDVIVSNPPYIEENDPHLTQGDLRFEPKSALASGKDGLDDIRHIIQQSKTYLKPRGWLLLEHGYNQAEAVAILFKKAEFNHISHVKDLADIKRVTLACKD